MKKILLLLLFFKVFVTYGQKDTITTKTIIYDFKTKKYTKANLCPRVGEPIVLKIKNINRLAYEVVIKSEDVAIADEYFKDGIENALKKTFTAGEISEVVTTKTIPEATVSTTSLKDQNETDKSLDQGIKNIQGEIDENQKLINEKISLRDNLVELIKNLTTTLENSKRTNKDFDPTSDQKIVDTKSLEVIAYQKDIDSLENLNLTNKNEIIKLNNTVNAVHETFNQFNKLYNDILYASYNVRSIDENYQNFYLLVLNPLLECSIYNNYVKDPKYILYQLPQYRSQIYDFEKTVTNFIDFYNRAMSNWKIFDAIKLLDTKENIRLKYQQYKEEVDKIKTSIDALNLSSKLRKVEAIHSILKEEKAYEMVSSPIQPLEDYVTFDVTIKHRDKNKSSEYNDNREFTYMEYTRGGVRFDFSTGIVMNFIGNNDKYGLTDVNVVTNGDGSEDTAMKKIVVTENNQFTPALAGMFHTSFRSCGIWAFGLTLGASVNVETFELNSLFPGVSVLIGKKQKFIISAGPAFRQVDELKANYREDVAYNSSDFTPETQLTAKQFKVGFFCGITYNLTQKQRAKFKIGTE
ncbi:hypothetical protein [Flavobacterium sp. Root420]|uniref:hypothetical protein n=1 Tax=Flavobacterium sp. Root420 TaxID=1736533 RepID=UPI0006FD5F95|nr:hypothetical protein [Flavobacterium sp. Root420]KQW98545.1 hypothetical protein ASC72_13655 [Flavobacterium sp. Root420]